MVVILISEVFLGSEEQMVIDRIEQNASKVTVMHPIESAAHAILDGIFAFVLHRPWVIIGDECTAVEKVGCLCVIIPILRIVHVRLIFEHDLRIAGAEHILIGRILIQSVSDVRHLVPAVREESNTNEDLFDGDTGFDHDADIVVRALDSGAARDFRLIKMGMMPGDGGIRVGIIGHQVDEVQVFVAFVDLCS